MKRAATLILVRRQGDELQTYLLRRSLTSGFMPGLFVFPGGMVDDFDCDEPFWEDHQDLTRQAITERFGKGLSFSDVLSNAVAAVRETFEEAGILLASKPTVCGEDMKRACKRRIAESRQHGWFRKMVETEGWRLTVSALAPWAQWITPVGMPRRFDTRFFVATLPSGQFGQPDLRETTEGLWASPRQALAGNIVGRTPLSPPTLVTLHQLLEFPTLEALLESLEGRGWGEPIFPQLAVLGKEAGSIIIEPWDPQYGREDLQIDIEKLPDSTLPPWAPFSRLWYNGGIWKPVS
jgi:8-oxo-dGTP pyrophosphatase MutT (NUDIX family)